MGKQGSGKTIPNVQRIALARDIAEQFTHAGDRNCKAVVRL